MEQIKAFIEKAKTDSELMAKLDAAGARNAAATEVIAIAAEYGFIFTVQDYEQAKAAPVKMGELNEEELDSISGGWSEDRYDPKVCKNLTRVKYECVGFMAGCWCDHYRRVSNPAGGAPGNFISRHDCVMGAFSYEGRQNGDPL